MTHTKRRKVGEAKSEAIRDIPAACTDEATAVAYFERMRWGDTPACPRCGDTKVRQMVGADGKRNARFLWRCYGCQSAKRHAQFSWRIGTPAEDSRIPARIWVYAFWRAISSKKGVSALEIKRQTGLSYESALFLMHRIRFAMTAGGDEPKLTGTVEADETYVGGAPRNRTPGNQAKTKKIPVLGAVERGGRLRLVVGGDQGARVTAATVKPFVDAHLDRAARLCTDEGNAYRPHGREFTSHDTVNHKSREWARQAAWGTATTNTIEGAFSLLKRALYGTWHAVSPKRLPLYLAEVAFRYNTRAMEDGERLAAAVRAAHGKRLMAQ